MYHRPVPTTAKAASSYPYAGRLNHSAYAEGPTQTSKSSCEIGAFACKIRCPCSDQSARGRLLRLASSPAVRNDRRCETEPIFKDVERVADATTQDNERRDGNCDERVDRFAAGLWEVGALPPRAAHSRLVRSASCLLGPALAPGSAGAASFSATPESLRRSDATMRW